MHSKMCKYQRGKMTMRAMMLRRAAMLLGMIAIVAPVGMSVAAGQSNEALAKAAQNPVANLISVPFQNNTNFNVGPEEKTQNILNIQPVIPVSLNSDWNLITRTIVPVISQPEFAPGEDRKNGIGDIQWTGFLSPARPRGLIWGVGPAVQMPTNSDDRLGNDRWGLGPSIVVLHTAKGDPWVYGALVNNIWSVGSGDDPGYNNFVMQPFLNYNLKDGLYLTSSPVITANWKEDGDNRWTVPLGGGVGKIFRFGKLPINSQAQAFYNVETPDDGGADWSLRLQLQLMFPK